MREETLTMIPGPTPVHPAILGALARPTVSHVAPGFVAESKEAIDGFRRLCRSEKGQAFVVAGGGTLSMEMAVVNLVAPGEKLLVVSHGYFGDRFIDLAQSFGIQVDALKAEWGKVVPPAELEAKLKAGSYAAVTITHVDTSTGTLSPVAEYAKFLKGRPEMFILDGVCATGGVDERMDDWGVDVILTAPQKAIAAPPGVALVTFSERALARRQARASVPGYYADILRWLPIMQDPGKYFSTPAVNEVTALAEALRMIHREGLDARFARHARIAQAVRAGVAALGLELFTDAGNRGDTLSVIRLPEGVEDLAFRKGMAERGIVVAGGLGPIAGKTFRLGHMGNIAAGEITAVLKALEETLASLGVKVTPGAAVAAAAPFLP
ncbi:pyridoxal-phosphate-dependent aminotransferase family protein [Mesoterricola sediminis]|uniref:Serine--pyruvate aminotransferase n=1 Tax=Mesoterricola sediminis TaxID=2927980 RepID=A0AA48GQI8_9BACT|nr:alanine--glyoxylate aminotransferase family protein [Mesoterricola sediminis]BDU75744.1 serine--pyruvate aminotransferase [Mesoterricola sediminis]